MSGYKHPCNYCGEFIAPDVNHCPFCKKINPLGPLRCPKCREPIEREHKVCGNCGLSLKIICPACGKETFFGDYCDLCGARLVVVCKKCRTEQPPVSGVCIRCNKPLEKGGSK